MAKIGQNGDKHGPRKQVDVVGPRWRSAPFNSKLSKLLLAFQLSLSIEQQSSSGVEQEWSFSQSPEESSGSGIAPLQFFHFSIYLIQYLFKYFILALLLCITLSTQSLVFIISELRCLLFGVSSIGYLIISSLSLVPVPPSGQSVVISFHWSLV